MTTAEETRAFANPADAGFSLIMAHREGRFTLTDRSGSFCGQLVAGMPYLSDKQKSWLATLLSRAALPPLADGGR
jgi:hypothetical protein